MFVLIVREGDEERDEEEGEEMEGNFHMRACCSAGPNLVLISVF